MKLILVTTVAAALFAQSIVAQEAPEGPIQNIIFDDSEGTRFDPASCWFVEGRVRDIMETADDYRAIAEELRNAEPPIRRYVEDSLDRQQDAVAMALRDFAAWHRHRVSEDNANALAQQQMATILGSGLSTALNIVFPGAGLLNQALRTAGNTAYSQLTSNAGGGTTDPQTYLNQIGDELADSEALRRTLSDAMFNSTDNQSMRDVVEAIKFEYAMERRVAVRMATQTMTELRPDSCSGQMLADMGLLRPTVANFNMIRRDVLTELMHDVLCLEARSNAAGLTCAQYPARYRAIARAGATRLILVGRGNVAQMWNLTRPEHLRVICPDYHEFGAFSGPSPDCRAWATVQRTNP